MRILITGIAGRLAQLVGGVLASRPGTEVIGLGGPAEVPAGIEALDITLRGPALIEALRELQPDVAIHLDQPGEEEYGARAGHLRAVDLLGACAEAGVPRVIVRSSTLVYGASPNNPAFLAESAPLHPADTPGLQTDYVAIERFIEGCATRHPAMAVVTLRCAPVIGGGVRSPLAHYLGRDHPPILAGYSPRIQVLHAEDAVVAFALAALGDVCGAFNLAADDPIPLERAIRLAGRSPLPLLAPAFSSARLTAILTRPIRAQLPFDPAFLQYACVADTGRAKRLLGWEARHTAADAIATLRTEH